MGTLDYNRYHSSYKTLKWGFDVRQKSRLSIRTLVTKATKSTLADSSLLASVLGCSAPLFYLIPRQIDLELSEQLIESGLLGGPAIGVLRCPGKQTATARAHTRARERGRKGQRLTVACSRDRGTAQT